VAAGVEQMLERLQLEFVDVLMAHSPPVPPLAWAAMEAAVDAGQARALGVSNFDRPAGRGACGYNHITRTSHLYESFTMRGTGYL
jgi:diketogulonate reductase-like aldo/keto reductase